MNKFIRGVIFYLKGIFFMDTMQTINRLKKDLNDHFQEIKVRDLEKKYNIKSYEARITLLALRLDKDIECRLGAKRSTKHCWEFRLGKKDYSKIEIDIPNSEYITEHLPKTEEGYKLAVFCENLKTEFATINLLEKARLFQVDKYTVKQWLDKLTEHKIIVKSPTGTYKLILSEENYQKAADEVFDLVDNEPIQPFTSETSGKYITIPEAEPIENATFQIHALLGKLSTTVEKQLQYYSALHLRDEHNNENYKLCISMQESYNKLYAENKELQRKLASCKETVTKMKQQSEKDSELQEMLMDKAVNNANKEFIKYQNIIMKIIQAELPANRTEQIRERFETMHNKLIAAFVINKD